MPTKKKQVKQVKDQEMSPQNNQQINKKNSRSQQQSSQKTASQIQQEVNLELNEIIAEIIEDPFQTVKSAHVKTMIQSMHRSFKFFKSAFLLFLDKIITIEEKDTLIKGLYKLLEKFYNEIALNQALNTIDVSTLMSSALEQLVGIYNFTKLTFQVQFRAAYMITQIASHFGIANNERIKLDSDLKFQISETAIDMLHSQRSTIQIYGVQLSAHLCNQQRPNDQLFIHLMKVMTHNRSREVRRASLFHLKAPYSQVALMFISKRLRDKDEDIRKLAFQKLYKNGVKLEDFKSLEQRMLIIKEGLTDPNESVRGQCIEFLKLSLYKEDGSINDLSIFFKLIDCKKMFIKEYYIQLPFIIMRFMFHCLGENEIQIAQFLEQILLRLKIQAGIVKKDQEMNETHINEVLFEDLLFLRIAFEFSKMYRRDRQPDFVDYIDQISLDFNQYNVIFNYLLQNAPLTQVCTDVYDKRAREQQMMPDRLIFSEWLKFSLQLSIEEEVTRRNLVSLMFTYIGQIKYSYQDYQHLLRHKTFLLQDQYEETSENHIISYDSDELDGDLNELDNVEDQEQQVIEIEIRAFQDLNMQKDILEYCKPFSFESLVMDSDDVCRIAVIVARKLLDQRIDEFSLSMLQAISDIKEPLEDGEDQSLNYKKQRDSVYQKLEAKLEGVNELIMQEDYSILELNTIMKKVRGYVNLIEEINLKEKLSYKRALNMCLILLKQCRADVNDQNLISICDTLIGPTIKSKDKDNMLLAIECIGLLCLLDKELFQNYSKIFQRILVEDVMQDNLREKIIALKSSVDSLIIHGVDSKTQKLQKIIIEDYMVIKDKVLRQITIEGICKMLFSRKLTLNNDNTEIEFLLSQLIIQWFDKKFNWQNSLVRQILNTFFKSFVLFSQQRCEIMLRALLKVIYSILEAKYGEIKPIVKKKQLNRFQMNKRSVHNDEEESDDYSVDENDAYNSDDSRCGLSQALMQNIVKELDPVQITKIFMLLLSQEYVNQNAAKEFKLQKDLNIDFLMQICYLNSSKFKKVAIVKEYVNSIMDYVDVNSSNNWRQLETLGKYLDLNSKMLIQGNQKLKKVKECIDKRIVLLQKEDQEYAQLLSENAENQQDKYCENLGKLESELLEYYQKEILDTVVDLVIDDDQEYQELNTVQVQGLDQSMYSPFSLKNNSRLSNVSDNNQSSENTGRQLRRRRSGLRSNRKSRAHSNTVIQNSNKLRSIPEVEEMMKDISSSEKPKIKNKLCDTILEERDYSQEDEADEDMEEEEISESSKGHGQAERHIRQGIMSKISKKMARDFEQNKKKSILQSNSASSCTQINEQRMKEEYMDGRTVFKISKHKSISPINPPQIKDNMNYPVKNLNDYSRKDSIDSLLNNQPEVANNLSVRFDDLQNSDPKQSFKNHSNDSDQLDQSLSISSIKKQLKQNQKSRSRKAKASLDSSESVPVVQTKNPMNNKPAMNRSFNLDPSVFKPNRNLITRSRMKSISSSSMNNSSHAKASNDIDSSDQSDSNSSENVFAFMESQITKKKKEALAKQKAKSNNVSQNVEQQNYISMKEIKKIGKRVKKDYDNSSDESDMIDLSLISKENKKNDNNRLVVGQKKGSVRGKKA